MAKKFLEKLANSFNGYIPLAQGSIGLENIEKTANQLNSKYGLEVANAYRKKSLGNVALGGALGVNATISAPLAITGSGGFLIPYLASAPLIEQKVSADKQIPNFNYLDYIKQ